MDDSKLNGDDELHSNCRDLYSSLKKNSMLPSDTQTKLHQSTSSSVESKYFLKFSNFIEDCIYFSLPSPSLSPVSSPFLLFLFELLSFYTIPPPPLFFLISFLPSPSLLFTQFPPPLPSSYFVPPSLSLRSPSLPSSSHVFFFLLQFSISTGRNSRAPSLDVILFSLPFQFLF